jgi:hypothetical protein
MAAPPSPWPRLRDSWWVYLLVGVAIVLFPVSLITEVRCGVGRCAGSFTQRLWALDAVGGLPRLYTAGLFVAAAVLAGLARRRTTGRAQQWWTAVAAIGAGLAVAKTVSVHSTAKGASPAVTLLGGVVLTVLVLSALAATGRRWGVAAVLPVTLALALYAGAALGLDAVTTALIAAQDRAGLPYRAAVTFVEELGEAVAAIVVLVAVRWNLPVAPSSRPVPGAGGQKPGRTSPHRQA